MDFVRFGRWKQGVDTSDGRSSPVKQLAEPALSSRIYQLAFDAFRADPVTAIGGFLKAFLDYFTPSGGGAFGFVWDNLGPLNTVIIRSMLYALSGLGLLTCFWRRHDPNFSLLLALTAGILISVPLVPPIDSDGMRAYAATIPVSAVWVALGLVTILRVFNRQQSFPKIADHSTALSPVFFGVALAVFCFLSPIAVRVSSRPTYFERTVCPTGQESIYIRTSPGMSVNLVADNQPSSHLPNIRLSDFRNGMRIMVMMYPELGKELLGLEAGKTIAQAADLGNQGAYSVWVIAGSDLMPPSSSILRICARPTENQWVRNYRFYYANSIQTVSAKDVR